MHAIPRGRGRQMLPNLWLGSLRALAAAILCVYALGAVGSPPPAQAIDLSDGDLRLTLDTTLSHGLTFRVEERDDLLISDVNGNDGDLNYDRGLVSNTSKFTTDLDLGYHNFGAFLRLNGFLDFENEHGERARTPLSDEAKELVGQDIILLDAYLTGAFDIGNVAIDLRLGSHVLNWGESTFIQNGINAINPFDVSKLRLPGSELREGLLPVPMVSASVALTDTLTMEGFYQLVWEKTQIDPVGSYFSVTDYVGPGAEKAIIALPGLPLGDMGLTPQDSIFTPTLGGLGIPPECVFPSPGPMPGGCAQGRTFQPDDEFLSNFLTVPRHADRTPDDAGQWGVALRYFAEGLNSTDFGFYYMNYHSRLPVVSGHTGTSADAQAGLIHALGLVGTAAANATQQAIGDALLNKPDVAGRIVQAAAGTPDGGMVVQNAIGDALLNKPDVAGRIVQAAAGTPDGGMVVQNAIGDALLNKPDIAGRIVQALIAANALAPTDATNPAAIQAALGVAPQAAAGVVLTDPMTVQAVIEAAPQAAAGVVLMDPDTVRAVIGAAPVAAANALFAADPGTEAAVRATVGQAARLAAPIGIDKYAENAYYFIEYLEDIQLLGVSFSTEVGTTGWALQGEYSFRPDAPLQLAERKVFAEALAPFNDCLAAAAAPGAPPTAGPDCIAAKAAAGDYDSDGPGRGYILRDMSQAQVTATKVFGPVLGSDSGAFVSEVAVLNVHNMPEGKGINTVDANGTPNPAFANATPIESPAGEPDDDDNTYTSDADATSWGYRLATRLDYNNAIGAVNLFPYLQFQHDVGGNSPSPSGSFVEGRTAVTLGLRAGYLSRWEADLNFTSYNGSQNELLDRDFISATVKYSF